MDAPRTSAGTRRRQLAKRAVSAAALVATAVLVVAAAVVVGRTSALVVAGVYAAAVAVVSARLLSQETADVRREWAGDRAALSARHGELAERRAVQNAEFAAMMAERLRTARTRAEDLEERLHQAERDRLVATTQLSSTQRHVTELEDDVDSLRTELRKAHSQIRRLRDQLTAGEIAESELRAQLMAWQETQAAEDADQASAEAGRTA